MQFKYIVLITWFVGLILYVGGWYLKDNTYKYKALCNVIFAIGMFITCVTFIYLVFGVILPNVRS